MLLVCAWASDYLDYDSMAYRFEDVCQFCRFVRIGTLLAYPLDEAAPVG